MGGECGQRFMQPRLDPPLVYYIGEDTGWKRCFLKTSVSNGIIYTKYTQIPHIIEPPFNIATQSATYTVTACVSRWEPNVLNANNPCPAARQKQYWYFISLLRFSALKCKPNGQKTVAVLENMIIESLHIIETEL